MAQTAQTGFRFFKLIAGATLAVLGSLILHENLAGAAAWLSQMPGSKAYESLGRLPGALLALSQALQAYAPQPQRLAPALLQHLAVSCWPLVLVTIGTALSLATDKDRTCQK